MKRIAIILGAALLIITSCADDQKQPIITFDQALKGAYVRLLSETTRDIDLFNVNTWSYTYSIEFVDLEKGGLVSEYTVDVTFRDNNPDNGDRSGGPSNLLSFSSSDFGQTSNGFAGLENITITASDLAGLFGMTPDDLGPGDQFVVNGTITTTDGAVFTGANSTGAVNGSAFQGHFDFTFSGVCPTSLAGTYDVTVVSTWCGAADAVGGRQVTLTQVAGTTGYDITDFSFGAYFPCYGEGAGLPLGNLRMVDVCNKIFIEGASQWGEIYTWHSLTVDGSDMTVEWSNDYGEGGTSIIINPSGWPALHL